MLHYGLLSLVVIGLDQWSKAWAVQTMALHQSIELLPVFNFTLAHNHGAAFSFLSDAGGWQRWLFTLIALGVTCGLLVWLSRLSRRERWLSVALCWVIGGALAHLYDRITLGYVIDFLHVHWQGYHFPVFNLADSAISIGVAMMLIDTLWLERKRRQAV